MHFAFAMPFCFSQADSPLKEKGRFSILRSFAIAISDEVW
jgi:hypothetical protein